MKSQSLLVKQMQCTNASNNTGSGWIWTQWIPLWGLIAVPVTLNKLNNQFYSFIQENKNVTNKLYSNTWGWIWYASTIISIVVPFIGFIGLIAWIVFWIHIVDVRKNLILQAQQ
jgi:hypothetical protein